MPTLGNFTFNTNAFALRTRALMEVGMADTEFLGGGSADWTADAQFVALLNEVESEVYSLNPALGMASTDVTIAAGASSVALPAAVWGSDVVRVACNLDGYEGRTISVAWSMGAEDAQDVAPTTALVPAYCYFNEDRSELSLQAPTTVALPVTIHYRAKPTTFTTAMLAAGNTTYSAIPTEFMRCPALLLASKFAFIIGDVEKAQVLLARYSAELEHLGDRLASSLAADRRPAWANAGQPRTLRGTDRGSLVGATSTGYYNF